ncbi:transcriptional repressor [Cyanobacterium aponinum FACHB-4101]|uniref:Fur family transcriptional regulator n=1 Tax=Cyanobacterium aponinum TaxID=379064 RepID=UPI0016807FED|nr:Fur family transcriptional regulator [Cyanobacterium aponinum]MBD2393620.1 transcriptional repressor [Cyanobacterium aponinum FACHB-4101]
MVISKDNIIKTLKSKGLRVTPQRFAVYSNLLHRCDHPTAEQILTDLNQEVPTLSQATVYLSLQTLQNVGLVKEVLLEEGVCRYDANVVPHHHFLCECCGEIEDIPWESLTGINISNLRQGLKVDRFEVTVYGRCDRCSDSH